MSAAKPGSSAASGSLTSSSASGTPSTNSLLSLGEEFSSFSLPMPDATKNRSAKNILHTTVEEVPMSTYYETMPHKYFEIQNRYTQALISGRHPTSFHKKSELWHHFSNSKERTDNIAKGHGVWNTLAISHEKIKNDMSEHDLRPRGVVHQSGIFNKRGKANVINNVQIDSKTLLHLHYGMSAIIMNYLDEVLVATRYNELKCKERDKILPTDKIIFKIIDIEDPTNPSALYLGDQLWLQCCDYDEVDKDLLDDDAMESGFVLGSKLFAPPEMSVVHLDLGIKKELPPKSPGNHGNLTDTSTGKEIASPLGNNPASPSRGSSSFLKEAKEGDEVLNNVASISNDKANNYSSVSSPSDNKINITDRPASPNVDSPDKKGHFKGNDIVGTAGLVGICDQVSVQAEIDGIQAQQKITTKYVGKIALQSGRWVPMDAQRKANDDKKKANFGENPDSTTDPKKKKNKEGKAQGHDSSEKREKLMSLTPIYLEQDLYVLGSTHGTPYQPWPKFSLDFVEISSLKLNKKPPSMLDTPMESDNDGDEPTRPSTSDGMANMTGGESVTRRFNIAKVGDHLEPSPHLCLRRKVHQAPPYAFVIDRRCVWKFHVVENPGALTGNTKDQQAQRIMIKAKESLKKSEMQRKGARVHSEVKYEGEKLLGGESFSKTLRAVLMQSALDLECKAMHDRRAKENNLMKTMEDIYFRPDPEFKRDDHSSTMKSRRSVGANTFDENSSIDSFSQSIDSTNIGVTHKLSNNFFITGGGSNNNSRSGSPQKDSSRDDASANSSNSSSSHSKNQPASRKSSRATKEVSSPSKARKPGLLSSASSTSSLPSSTPATPTDKSRKESPKSKKRKDSEGEKIAAEMKNKMSHSQSDSAMLQSASILTNTTPASYGTSDTTNSNRKSVRFEGVHTGPALSKVASADAKDSSYSQDRTKGHMNFGKTEIPVVKYKSRSTIMEESIASSQQVAKFSTPKSHIATSLVSSSAVFNGFSNLNVDNLRKPPLLFSEPDRIDTSLETGDRFATPVYCTIPKIHSTYISGPKSFAGYKGVDDKEEQERKKKQTFGSGRRKVEEKVDNAEGHMFSQGEKIIALHNSMTTSTETFKEKMEMSKLGSPMHSRLTSTAGETTHSPGSPHDDPWAKNAKEAKANSLARCLHSLTTEDKLIEKAINYKDKVEQYKRVSQLFSDITF